MGIHQFCHRSCCGNPSIPSSDLLWESTFWQFQHPTYCGNPPIPSSELLWESMRVYNSIRWMYFNNDNYNLRTSLSSLHQLGSEFGIWSYVGDGWGCRPLPSTMGGDSCFTKPTRLCWASGFLATRSVTTSFCPIPSGARHLCTDRWAYLMLSTLGFQECFIHFKAVIFLGTNCK